MGNLLAEQDGIQFGEISYVPGSVVRATALMQGNIKATFLDIANKELVMKEAPGKFHVLPTGGVNASDESLYARQGWLEQNPQTGVRLRLRRRGGGGRARAQGRVLWRR